LSVSIDSNVFTLFLMCAHTHAHTHTHKHIHTHTHTQTHTHTNTHSPCLLLAASDTHLYLALEWLERSGKKYGSGHEGTKTASQACLAAHLMRYGRVPNNLLVEIFKHRSEVRVSGED